uniref:Uncharacterized protein n=1 Tax=Moniliophthora roreri TaxID=221103 RepID=A0A0W0F528_MONRR
MQSWRSVSLLSVLFLLFAQLVSALPNPGARELEARVADPEPAVDAIDVKARGWDDNDWDDYDWNDNVWDVIVNVQTRISIEVDAIKQYENPTYDDCSKHIERIRRYISRIHKTIEVKHDSGINEYDIFGHDSEEIRVRVVAIINIITDLVNHFYSIGISVYVSILVDLLNDVGVWLQLSTRVVVGLSASLSTSINSFLGVSSGLGVSISL